LCQTTYILALKSSGFLEFVSLFRPCSDPFGILYGTQLIGSNDGILLLDEFPEFKKSVLAVMSTLLEQKLLTKL
jgi:hypothetical protein